MEPIPINRFIKKPVLEPVYETGLPALIYLFHLNSSRQIDFYSNYYDAFKELAFKSIVMLFLKLISLYLNAKNQLFHTRVIRNEKITLKKISLYVEYST